MRLRHFWQKGFYDQERKETVADKAPIGGSRGQRSCQGTQGTDTAADTGGCYFRESISTVRTNDFGTIGGFFMRGFQTNTVNCGRSGQSGRFSFFSKGALTHHPLLAGGGIPPVGRDRALSEGDTAVATALWTMPHFCGIAVIVHAVGALLLAEIAALFRAAMCANCHRKTSPGRFSMLWVSPRRHPFSFCEKETKTGTKGW